MRFSSTKRAIKSQARQAALVIFCTALFCAPVVAAAADLNFSPASGTHAVGEEFTVQLLVSPGQDSVNAADGTVSFDNTLLTLESFSKDGSVFSLWTSEPVISQSDGTLVFSGGTPTAFSQDGTVLTLKFMATKAGTAKVSITKGSVLAADGKGTDVFKNGGSASYTITDAPPAAAASDTSGDSVDSSQSSDGTDAGPPPIAPTIDSSTFLKEDSWYATSTGIMTWNLPPDATGVRTLVSTLDNQTPSTVQKGLATSTTITGLKDGVSYFYVQVKNGSGWGDIAKRKIQIDTVPPDDFQVTLDAGSNGSPPKLNFKATDELSGIDHYEVLFGSTSVATLLAKDVADGSYQVPPQDGGQTQVTIKAYDAAGNVRVESAMLNLPKIDKPKSTDAGTTPAPASSSWFSFDRILVVLFAFVIGALVTWIRSTKKLMEQKRQEILDRIAAMGDKNDRVFSAMREEFEQMINDFDKKPQLTPEERALLEDIKEVLDMSEEIIDTEVDELKKAVRAAKGI
ncbi:MAG TPA: cohesin domain-containing protein [Candidatus Paceibacterota bacterium]|nr:cohesin domain-containing protein [Candidatus Paceibacterota bacterium]